MYRELAKLIGYQGISYPISQQVAKRFGTEHDQDWLAQAIDELIGYEPKTKRAILKDSVRRLCMPILGPAPEDWEEFYANIENPPPNPYKASQPEQNSPEAHRTDLSAAGAAPQIDLTRGMDARRHQAKPRRTIPPPEMSAEQMLKKLDDSELLALLEEARRGKTHYGIKSLQGRQFRKDIAMAEAECCRRGLDSSETPPGTVDSDVVAFRKHTTPRLRELLDICQYEVAKHDPETVTHQEAARGIGFIEAELRRRRANESAQAGSRGKG